MTYPVEQMDRDAAADRLGVVVKSSYIDFNRDRIRSGAYDGHAWVQAFAKHRIEAVSTALNTGMTRKAFEAGYDAGQEDAPNYNRAASFRTYVACAGVANNSYLKAVDDGLGNDWFGDQGRACVTLPGAERVEIPTGMKPWAGGDSAPADWDGGRVMFRHGGCSISRPGTGLDWRHGAIPADIVPDGRTEIIAYTPRPTNDPAGSAAESARDIVERVVMLCHQGCADEAEAIVAALHPNQNSRDVAGAEAMREACAKVAEARRDKIGTELHTDRIRRSLAGAIAAAIRALPIPSAAPGEASDPTTGCTLRTGARPMLKVSQGAREAAAVIAEVEWPGNHAAYEDEIAAILAPFEATARKQTLEGAAKVADKRAAMANTVSEEAARALLICLPDAIRALGSQNDG